jgi:hypothetical protein
VPLNAAATAHSVNKSRARAALRHMLPDEADAAAELVAIRRDHPARRGVAWDLCDTRQVFSARNLAPRLARSVFRPTPSAAKTRVLQHPLQLLTLPHARIAAPRTPPRHRSSAAVQKEPAKPSVRALGAPRTKKALLASSALRAHKRSPSALIACATKPEPS